MQRRSLHRLLVVLAVVAAVSPLALVPPAARAAPQGAWALADDLHTSRASFALATLNDGRVLASGGYTRVSATNTQALLDSAELYDPATDTWTATGDMLAPRDRHTAVTLTNGKVLIAGGADPTVLNSAELFDPATNAFTSTGSMTTARVYHAAVRLTNGKVLAAGGLGEASAELYSPFTGQWTPTGSLHIARESFTLTLLADGRVLAAGGIRRTPTSFVFVASSEIYDPATGVWTLTSPMTVKRARHAAIRLNDGRVLVAGGENATDFYLASAQLYDPTTDTWTPTGAMATRRYDHTLQRLSDGFVLAADGNTDSVTATTEAYNPATGTWLPLGTLSAARYATEATRLPSGQVLLTGGWHPANADTLATTELFTFTPNEKPQVTAPVHTIRTPQHVVVAGGSALQIHLTWSGSDPDGIASFTLEESIAGGAWSTVALPDPTATSIDRLLRFGTSYRYRVRASDPFGALSPWAAGQPFTLVGHQETDSAIDYIGHWSAIRLDGAWGEQVKSTTYVTTEVRGAQVTFTGSGIVWVTTAGPNYGAVELALDGRSLGVIDLYAPSVQVRQVLFARVGTTSGAHTLGILVRPEKNPASSGRRVDFDGFVVVQTH